MTRVLFVCVHNAARSQMAEAFLNRLGEGRFTAQSAGLEPGTLNPYVVRAMQEIGYDLSGNQTKGVFDFYREAEGQHVCADGAAGVAAAPCAQPRSPRRVKGRARRATGERAQRAHGWAARRDLHLTTLGTLYI